MQVARQRSRNGKANKSSRPVKKEITIPELSSTPSFCRDGEKPPKLKKQGGESNYFRGREENGILT